MSRNQSARTNLVDSATKPSARMRPLQRLIGTWITEGIIVKRDKPTDERFTFIDQYEWLPGGHFIAHTVNGEMNGQPLQGLEVIGYEGRTLHATSYDSLGVITRYRPSLRRRDWSMIGEHERFRGTFSADGKHLDGKWERKNARGDWHATMQVALTRVGS